MASPVRVVIAEDNYLVREGTRRLLEDSAEVEVVAAVGTASELIDAVERLRPQAVLTDIRMPPGHSTEGIEAAHSIRASHRRAGWWCCRSTPKRRMRASFSDAARQA